MLPFLSHLLAPWTWRMAWRDTRASRRRLLLFSTSIVLGIAALVAVGSLQRNLRDAVDEHAKTLLGADLVISSRQPFTAEDEALFASLGGVQSRQVNFHSMIFFPKTQGTRLIQVRALEGGFPYYGKLETTPPEAAETFRRGAGVLVEETVLLQFNARVGDPVRIGQLETRVAGSLQKVPGETVVFATIAPRVYLAMADVEKTGLLGEGSLAGYRVAFQFPATTNVTQLVKTLQPRLDENRLAHTTVAKRKEDVGRSLDNLYHYLNLVGFIALLLGAVGVASGVHTHIRRKLDTVAVLRCLGCTASQTFAIYLLQGAALGVFGAAAGAILGLVIQRIVPAVLGDFLPLGVAFAPSWLAVGEAMAVGFATCLLFALLPLLSVRTVSPLAAIRASYESTQSPMRDPWRWFGYVLIAAGVIAFALMHSRKWQHGLAFAGGLGVALAALAITAKGLALAVRRFTPARLPYVWRQGLANLHRPQNRTVLLVLAIGLGTFLLLTGYLTQSALLHQLKSAQQSGQGDTVLFDIQPDQREGLESLLRTNQWPLIDQAPMITMRLHSIKGRTVESLLAAKDKSIPRWALRREYRSTYGERLRDGERLIAGEWPARAVDARVPISVEDGIARELGVGLGDELIFDVQGVLLTNRVAGLREVDWKRIQPNFFIVFPPSALTDAPTMFTFVTRVETAERSAALQRAVVPQFPNVSVIDLRLILQTVEALLSKVSLVVRFMALFVVLTGVIVLAGSIFTSRVQRLRESLLLRTLGASRGQLRRIMLAEFFCLGLLAALTGVLLALPSSWAVSHFVFDAKWVVPPLPLGVAVAGVTGLTLAIGLAFTRGVASHPPLEVLRAEG